MKREKNILFVEDDKDTQELVRVTLALDGYGIVIAPDCAEGLRLAQKEYFELYILDNWLPDGSGIDLCRRIREFDQRTPILFYSGAGYERDTQVAIGSGAQEYLIKPIGSEELKQAVARLVSRPSSC